MSFIPALLFFVAVINILFALVVVLRNSRSLMLLLFGASALAVSAWAISDAMMLAANNPEVVILWSKFFYITPMFIPYLTVLFAYIYPGEGKIPKWSWVVYLTPLLLLSAVIIIQDDFIITSIDGTGVLNTLTVNKTNFMIYGLYLVIMFNALYFMMLTKLRKTKGTTHSQLQYLLIGILLGSIPALVTNLVLPYSGNTDYIWLGPIFSLIYIVTFAYAMRRHNLFDIRAAIARSFAYVLSLGTMLTLYVVLIFGATSLFLDDSAIDNTQKLVYAVFAVLIAFTFQPLKNFFDKLTDKIFYRNKYDSEKLLSDYTDFLVDEIDTEKVINSTLTLMNEIANPSTSLVVLYKEGMGEWHDINGLLHGDDRDELAKALEYQADAVYVAGTSKTHADPFLENIKEQLIKNTLKVSVRLSTHGQLEGFILLGDKKSGSRYTQKDLSFFATIANELSVSLQNSQRFDQIQRFNVTLQREVDEATAQLKLTNKKLKQLDTAKDEFISMASHQLRTPLTAVKGYVSMVMDGDAGKISEEQKKLLGEAFSSSQRMVYLIADLLNVSRIKTGKFVIEPIEVDLAKMVQEEVDQLTPTATTRQILIKYSPPASFPKLMLDKTKTRQVIMNFIDNAIYYTKGGGEIEVSIVAKKDHVEYRVKDDGIGIPSADQHKLFTKFFRASNAKKARPDGTGLGLYMAQKIITAQGGSITFKSKEGKGSTFGFNLPLQSPRTSSSAK